MLTVTGIRNRRVAADALATMLLADARPESQVRDLRASIPPDLGLDPEAIRALDPAYEVEIEFTPGQPDAIDVAFRARGAVTAPLRVTRDLVAFGPLDSYANRPAARQSVSTNLVVELRQHVRHAVPEHMVPSAFVLMDQFPLTPNGKINRAALPEPERSRIDSARREPPKNDVELQIVEVLRDVVGLDEVGIDDNFFDLGANSLLMVQASVRLRERLGRNVPLVRMFQFPTARSLAASLGEADAAQSAALKQSQDRAQARRDAMQRMRDLRSRART
jgi:acyl carrier protein